MQSYREGDHGSRYPDRDPYPHLPGSPEISFERAIMAVQGFSAQTLARQELEDTWRRRVEESQQRYQAATTEYRRLLQEEPDGRPHGPDSALARARQEESDALMEYSRMLRVFADLTVHGKLPEERYGALFERRHGRDGFVISIVDDDESIRDSTRQLLRSAGYEVVTFESAEGFLGSGAVQKTECIVLDVRMPGMDGLELQRHLNASGAEVPIVFVTAHDDASSRRQAIEAGAVDFLNKPFETNTLLSTIETAVTRHDVKRRDRQGDEARGTRGSRD